MFPKRGLLLLALFALLPIPKAFSNEAPAAAKISWEELLRWLPEDTETIWFAQGPIAIPKKDGDQLPIADVIAFFPTGQTFTFAKEFLRKEMNGQKILSAMEGSRRFTSPNNLGLMP